MIRKQMVSKYKILIEFIFNLISKSISTRNIVDGGRSLQIPFENRDDIIKEIEFFNTSNSLKFELMGSDSITINLITNRIYYQIENFKEHFDLDKLNNDFCVFDDKEYYIFDHQNEEVYHNSIKIDDNNFIINYIYYHKIFEFLKNDTQHDNFCTFNDKVKQQIISIIPEKGKFEIGYKNFKNFDLSDLMFKNYFNNLTEVKKEFIPFFKNEVYDYLKNYETNDRYIKLIENFELIFNNAKNNYDLYISGFSVQSFIDDFRDQQNKYLSSYRDILNKIYTYSISVPISLTATIIGLLNIKQGNLLALWAIAISYLLFSALSIYYQCYLKFDLTLLNQEFNLDKEKILKEKVIRNNEKMQEIIINIESRFQKLNMVIKTIIIVLFLFSLIVLGLVSCI